MSDQEEIQQILQEVSFRIYFRKPKDKIVGGIINQLDKNPPQDMTKDMIFRKLAQCFENESRYQFPDHLIRTALSDIKNNRESKEFVTKQIFNKIVQITKKKGLKLDQNHKVFQKVNHNDKIYFNKNTKDLFYQMLLKIEKERKEKTQTQPILLIVYDVYCELSNPTLIPNEIIKDLGGLIMQQDKVKYLECMHNIMKISKFKQEQKEKAFNLIYDELVLKVIKETRDKIDKVFYPDIDKNTHCSTKFLTQELLIPIHRKITDNLSQEQLKIRKIFLDHNPINENKKNELYQKFKNKMDEYYFNLNDNSKEIEFKGLFDLTIENLFNLIYKELTEAEREQNNNQSSHESSIYMNNQGNMNYSDPSWCDPNNMLLNYQTNPNFNCYYSTSLLENEFIEEQQYIPYDSYDSHGYNLFLNNNDEFTQLRISQCQKYISSYQEQDKSNYQQEQEEYA